MYEHLKWHPSFKAIKEKTKEYHLEEEAAGVDIRGNPLHPALEFVSGNNHFLILLDLVDRDVEYFFSEVSRNTDFGADTWSRAALDYYANFFLYMRHHAFPYFLGHTPDRLQKYFETLNSVMVAADEFIKVVQTYYKAQDEMKSLGSGADSEEDDGEYEYNDSEEARRLEAVRNAAEQEFIDAGVEVWVEIAKFITLFLFGNME